MEAFRKAKRMEHVHSDIRGPLYMEALEMQKKGLCLEEYIETLK